MPIQAKIIAANDVINGMSTVATGAKPVQYNPLGDRVNDFASGDSLSLFQTLAGRYLHHGGAGGSGNWEH